MFCSNLFFVFRFIFDFLLKSKKRLKMEMMKRWIIQGDEEEVGNEKIEEEVEV